MDIFSHIKTVLDELEKLPSVPTPLLVGVSEVLSAALQMDRELTRLRERQMATQQIKTEAKITNVLIVPASEIAAMIRARYPHIPAEARINQNTDGGLLTDPLIDVRLTWTVQSGDTKDVDVPADIARPTCGVPGCPALGCRPTPAGPTNPGTDQGSDVLESEVLEPQMHTYLPRPAERLGHEEFEDGF